MPELDPAHPYAHQPIHPHGKVLCSCKALISRCDCLHIPDEDLPLRRILEHFCPACRKKAPAAPKTPPQAVEESANG